MSDIKIDKSNIDAMYWAEKFCAIQRETDFEIDEGLMVGWFANYRFAVADPLQAEIERLNARLKVLQDAQVAAVNGEHRNLFKHTIEVEYALWGKEQSDD